MKIKNAILSTAVVLLSTFTLTANDVSAVSSASSSSTVKEITALIKDINFDLAKLDDQTIKVQFMINADDEIIVLQTNDARVDQKIKNHLNYAQIKKNDLEVNKIYIIPVSFKSEGSKV